MMDKKHLLDTTLDLMWIVLGLLASLPPTLPLPDDTNVDAPQEYCNYDWFNATCQKNEVVLVEAARYGRMNFGRCVKGNYGYLGCAVDVLGYMDSKCSGSHVCRFEVPGTDIFATEPCPADFASYLETSYRCVKVAAVESHECHSRQPILVPSTSPGFIASQITEESGLGTSQCPWLIEVNPGQRINISLFNFARTLKSSELSGSNTDVCFDVIQIREGNSDRRIVNLCGRDKRETWIYLSRANSITIEFLNRKLLSSIGKFLLKYKAVSCPDVQPPPDAWVKREGDRLTIQCNATRETWYLTCRHDSWVGEMVGNCTSTGQEEEIFPYGILVVVAIGILLGVLIGGALLVIILILSRRRSKHRPAEMHIYQDNKENMRILDSNNSNNGALGSTPLPDWIREGQYTDEGIVHDMKSPLPSRSRPPEDHQMLQAEEHHCHQTSGHICDVIPVSEAFTTFRPHTHLYEPSHFS